MLLFLPFICHCTIASDADIALMNILLKSAIMYTVLLYTPIKRRSQLANIYQFTYTRYYMQYVDFAHLK